MCGGANERSVDRDSMRGRDDNDSEDRRPRIDYFDRSLPGEFDNARPTAKGEPLHDARHTCAVKTPRCQTFAFDIASE